MNTKDITNSILVTFRHNLFKKDQYIKISSSDDKMLKPKA